MARLGYFGVSWGGVLGGIILWGKLLKIVVVFDSDVGPAETQPVPGPVTVRYSHAGETADDEIVRMAGGLDGSVVVVKPGVKYEQLARNQVEKSLRSNPVFEGKRMYLRAPGKLYCFGQ